MAGPVLVRTVGARPAEAWQGRAGVVRKTSNAMRGLVSEWSGRKGRQGKGKHRLGRARLGAVRLGRTGKARRVADGCGQQWRDQSRPEWAGKVGRAEVGHGEPRRGRNGAV